MGFGLVRGVFIIALLIGIINLTSIAKETEFKDSHLYARFKPMSVWIFSLMPKALNQVRTLKPEATDSEKTKPNLQEGNKSTNNLDSI